MRRLLLTAIIFASITVLHANPSLIGTWTATVEYNNSFDTYIVNLSEGGRSTVKASNNNAEQETTGNWFYDGTIFRLNATFRNVRIAYLPNIQWSSIVNFSHDNNSFNILGRNATNGAQSRITFYRSEDDNNITYNDRAIAQVFNNFIRNIPLQSRLAIVGITAENPAEAAFYVNDLTTQLVNSRRFTVLDRSDIDKVLAEQDFQKSGLVDDHAYVSIGKFIGATVVITGEITGTGQQKRLVIKAIDVLTSEILSMEQAAL